MLLCFYWYVFDRNIHSKLGYGKMPPLEPATPRPFQTVSSISPSNTTNGLWVSTSSMEEGQNFRACNSELKKVHMLKKLKL